RVDLRLAEDGWQGELARAAADALALQALLQLAVFLGEEPEAQLDALAQALAAAPAEVKRVLVFEAGAVATGSRWVGAVRERVPVPGRPQAGLAVRRRVDAREPEAPRGGRRRRRHVLRDDRLARRRRDGGGVGEPGRLSVARRRAVPALPRARGRGRAAGGR